MSLFDDFDDDELPEAWRLARRGDPETSFEAAGSLRAVRITKTRQAILDALAKAGEVGLCDEGIAVRYEGPLASPSGLRTRRSELVEMGLVVDSGRRLLTKSNRRTIVWVLANGRPPDGPVDAMVRS